MRCLRRYVLQMKRFCHNCRDSQEALQATHTGWIPLSGAQLAEVILYHVVLACGYRWTASVQSQSRRERKNARKNYIDGHHYGSRRGGASAHTLRRIFEKMAREIQSRAPKNLLGPRDEAWCARGVKMQFTLEFELKKTELLTTHTDYLVNHDDNKNEGPLRENNYTEIEK